MRRSYIKSSAIFLLIGTIVVVLMELLGTASEIPSPASANETINGTYLVTRVIDGDTIVIDFNGAEETVRLIGIDAPEIGLDLDDTECTGVIAYEITRASLEEKSVEIRGDTSQGLRDKYGRILGYVFLENNFDFNKAMIKQGYAREYTYYPNKQRYLVREEYRAAEKYAQENEFGLWSRTPCEQ